MVLLDRWTSALILSRWRPRRGSVTLSFARCCRSRYTDDSMTPSGFPQLVSDPGGELTDGRQAFSGAVLDQKVITVGLEHDGEFQIQNLVHRPRGGNQSLGIVRQLLACDFDQVHADAVHGRQHVRLGQVDPDMDPSDARALLEIGLVVRAQEQLVHPGDQCLLEAIDLGGAARDGRAGPGVALDGRVKVVDDPGKLGLGQRVETAEPACRRVVELDVTLDCLEERLPRHQHSSYHTTTLGQFVVPHARQWDAAGSSSSRCLSIGWPQATQAP